MATVKEVKEKAKQESIDIDTSTLEQKVDGIRLTEGELNLLNELNRKKEIVSNEVSFIAQQQVILDYRLEEAKKLYRDNIELEKQIGESFTAKYGNGTIDIENGVFIAR
jgi:hypothetical protein